MNSDNTIPSRGYLRSTATGSLFLTTFSLFRALGGILSLGVYQLLFSLIVATVTLALVIVAFRLLRRAHRLPESISSPAPVKSRAFKLAVILEAVAIPLSVGVLSKARRFEYILPVIALIVGLHFFAMLPAIK